MDAEVKILFENIKHFRQLLTEGVGEDVIIKAIENHEWIFIYYDAGDEEGKNATGARTIRPYVLGTGNAGNTLLRAWQDNPRNSWHFDNRATRKDSQYHDYWTDNEGTKPGWRLFDVAKITKAYPIGKKFNDSNGKPMIPAGYHEGGDDAMTSIIAYVSKSDDFQAPQKIDREFSGETSPRAESYKQKWDSIRNGNKNNRKITSDDVAKLSDLATRVYKTKKGSYLVVIDDKNNFQLMLVKDKDKQNIPDTAIVGSLPYLYDSLVKGNAPADDKFFNDMKNKTKAAVNQQQTGVNETDKPTIPYKKMTFFK